MTAVAVAQDVVFSRFGATSSFIKLDADSPWDRRAAGTRPRRCPRALRPSRTPPATAGHYRVERAASNFQSVYVLVPDEQSEAALAHVTR